MTRKKKRLKLSEIQRRKARGLVCRNCGARHSFVVYTRPRRDGRILRRRECRNCGQRMSTFEAQP